MRIWDLGSFCNPPGRVSGSLGLRARGLEVQGLGP